MAGRIETYVHSDSTTDNKGAAIVKVTCSSDFGARTEMFKSFAKAAAMHAYGALGHTRGPFVAGPEMWASVTAKFPDLEDQRQTLEHELAEPINVVGFALLRL